MPSPRQADESWIRGLLERYEGPLLAYARRLCRGDLERARDAVQDVFLRLVRAGRGALGDDPTVWLFRVCRNRALDVGVRALAPAALDGDQPGSGDGPLEHLERADDAAHLRALLEHLPERERELVRLKFEHGLSYRQMGAITGLTETNVGFLLHKALGALRARLPEASARQEHAS